MQSRFVVFNENFVVRCHCIPNLCSLRYPVFSTFRIPSAWSSCDVCAFACITFGEIAEINCVALQMCSSVSLECVKEVFWELFHQHCQVIQIFSFYQSFLEWLKPVWKILLSVSRSFRRSVSRCCICIASVTCVDNNSGCDYRHQNFLLAIDGVAMFGQCG